MVVVAVAGTRPARPRDAARAWTRRWGLALPIAGFLAVFVVYPIALLGAESLAGPRGLTFDAYRTLATTAYYQAALATSLLIATVTSALSTGFGVLFALALTWGRLAGRRLVEQLLTLMVVVPSFLVAFALIFVYGTSGLVNLGAMLLFGLAQPPLDFLYSWKGVVMADMIVFTPFVLQAVLAVLRLIDPALIEMSQSLGAGTGVTVRRVVLPLAASGIFAGSSVAFLLALNEIGVVLFLGSTSVVTLPVVVYSEAFVNQSLQMSAAAAVVASVMSLALFAVYRRALRSVLS
ncbi:MAG TPA: ABC transporter permease subunit [bacterium]|nr:ABC transporter permease subunit [bacterium]